MLPRLAAAQSAADTFLDRVPRTLLVGFVGFSAQTYAVVEPTQDRSKVGVKHVKREISPSFAAAGLAMLIGGLGAGLRWRGRLP